MLLSLFCMHWGATASADDSVVAEGAELKLVADDFQFTEGPAVDTQGNVFFTDQPNDRILKWTPGKGIETWMQPCGRSNGLFFEDDGNLLACADEKNQLWRIGTDKSHHVIVSDFSRKRFNGPNDVWVGKEWIYFTDPFYKRPYWQPNHGDPQLPRQVYRVRPDGSDLQVAAGDFKQPNGIVGDRERGLVYVADIGDKKTYQFTLQDDGSLGNRKLFCSMGSDGMTLDVEGNLYLTGKGVTVFDSNGKQRQVIDIPEGWTANVCFGGEQMQTLFVTASDSVYILEMRTQGLRAKQKR